MSKTGTASYRYTILFGRGIWSLLFLLLLTKLVPRPRRLKSWALGTRHPNQSVQSDVTDAGDNGSLQEAHDRTWTPAHIRTNQKTNETQYMRHTVHNVMKVNTVVHFPIDYCIPEPSLLITIYFRKSLTTKERMIFLQFGCALS